MEGKRFSLQSFSEDEFGKKLDRCLTDTLIKGGKYSWLYNMNISPKLLKLAGSLTVQIYEDLTKLMLLSLWGSS